MDPVLRESALEGIGVPIPQIVVEIHKGQLLFQGQGPQGTDISSQSLVVIRRIG